MAVLLSLSAVMTEVFQGFLSDSPGEYQYGTEINALADIFPARERDSPIDGHLLDILQRL